MTARGGPRPESAAPQSLAGDRGAVIEQLGGGAIGEEDNTTTATRLNAIADRLAGHIARFLGYADLLPPAQRARVAETIRARLKSQGAAT